MAFNVSALSNYTTENQDLLVSAAVLGAKTATLIKNQGNVMVGVKSAEKINIMDTDAVFQAGGTSTIANTITNSSFNQCGLLTINGSLTGCTINDGTASASLITSALSKIIGNTFVSDGSNHAVELTSIGAGSMTWDNQLSGYVTGGSGGSPITPTSTSNEAIYINVATASDFTINVADGATVPSVRVGASFTGSVNVVAGLKSFKFTL